MRLLTAFSALFLALSPMAQAQCTGQNVIDAMSAADRVALHRRAHAVPFAEGNLWKATRDGRTLHHDIEGRHGAGKVILRAAPQGTGIIAGGPMRAIFEALGVHDVVAKSTGTRPPCSRPLSAER